MRSHSSLTSTNKLPKFLPLALSALITFAPLVYFANHSVKLDIRNSGQQIIEMQLLENLKKTIALPQQFQQPSQPSQLPQQVIPNLGPLPSSDSEPTQNTRIENSITQAPLPAEVVEPKIENNSNGSIYNIETSKFGNGINYLAIREIDLNGKVTVSDIAYFECRFKEEGIKSYFDLSGRVVNSNSPFKIVRND